MADITTISATGSYYEQISSGKSVNTAADNAADLTIAQEETAQVNGYEVGTQNAREGKDLLNVADSALGDISDSLQRIRELAVQASSSALMSNDELQMIQEEIDRLKQDISDIANNTAYNTKNLLDGSAEQINIATGADGTSQTVDIGAATLEALGIADFDVTGDFDIKTIDNAISMVNANRSSVGAQTQSLDYAIGYNTQTEYNLTNALSRKEDTDMEKAALDKDRQEVLETYRLMMQRQEQERQERETEIFKG